MSASEVGRWKAKRKPATDQQRLQKIVEVLESVNFDGFVPPGVSRAYRIAKGGIKKKRDAFGLD